MSLQISCDYIIQGATANLVPSPPLAAFFAAMEKCANVCVCVFFHGCKKKSCEGRPEYEARQQLKLLIRDHVSCARKDREPQASF